jgi:hypothetical protein
MVALGDILDDSAELETKLLRGAPAQASEDQHVAAGALGMGTKEGRGVLTGIPDRLQHLGVVGLVVFLTHVEPIVGEGLVHQVWVNLDYRLALEQLACLSRHFVYRAYEGA